MITQALGNIVFILLLVLANGFFVSAEFAIIKLRLSQIEPKVRKGHRSAKIAKHILEHLDPYLSATQLAITLTSLGLGWLGEPLLATILHDPLLSVGMTDEHTIHVLSFVISFSFLTYITLVFGELGPKYLAIKYPEQTALAVALPLQLFYRIFRPFIWFLNKTSNFLLGSIGISPMQTSHLLHSPEELQLIVTEGAKTGVLNKTEQELISSIFEFSNTTAREIMVPRTDMVAINHTTPREKLIRIVTEEGYSRMPVYRESVDNIVGIIHTKDLISLLEHRELIILEDIIRPAHFVPNAIKISQLLREMQQRKISMAIVIDEFGGTEGLITMEDILEEIVGEIHDEYDEVLKDFELAADGSALVNARIAINVFNEKFGVEIPEDPEYETLNGFLYKITGRIPEVQEEIPYNDLHFTVLKKSQRRLRQVKVKKLGTPAG